MLLDILDIVLQNFRLEDHGFGPRVDHLGDGLSCIVHLKSVHQQTLGDFLVNTQHLTLNHEDNAVMTESCSRTWNYFLVVIFW